MLDVSLHSPLVARRGALQYTLTYDLPVIQLLLSTTGSFSSRLTTDHRARRDAYRMHPCQAHEPTPSPVAFQVFLARSRTYIGELAPERFYAFRAPCDRPDGAGAA